MLSHPQIMICAGARTEENMFGFDLNPPAGWGKRLVVLFVERQQNILTGTIVCGVFGETLQIDPVLKRDGGSFLI